MHMRKKSLEIVMLAVVTKIYGCSRHQFSNYRVQLATIFKIYSKFSTATLNNITSSLPIGQIVLQGTT